MHSADKQPQSRRELGRKAMIVLGSTAAVSATRYLLDPWLVDHLPFLLFIAAVAASTRWAGWRAGLVTVAISTLAGSYFFADPRLLARVNNSDALVELAVFAVVSSTIIAMLEREMGLRRKIEHAYAQLSVAQENARAEHSERLKAQRELEDARRLEAVGLLAGGVAHDFNNLLTVVLGSAELLRARSPEDPRLNAISRAAAQGADLVKQLLRFARREPLSLRQLRLDESVREGEPILRRMLPADVELTLDLHADAWCFNGDPMQVQQILQNLASNARDAMPQGGALTIRTERVTLNGVFTRSHPEVTPGEYVHLKVTDSGSGLSDEVRKRIFEPFFTTKGLGRGTGLGLAVVYGIVKQLQGHIYVDSKPELGTTFDVYLPRVKDEVPRLHEAGHEEGAPMRPLTILLVDDDETVLKVTADMLRSLGHEVVAQVGPAAALKALRDVQRPIDVLVTDVVMPWMNGSELAERVEQERPGTPCVFISGYSDNVILSRGAVRPGTVLVRKPFNARDLDRALRSVTMDGRAASAISGESRRAF